MNQFFTRFSYLLVLILLTESIYAQQEKDYSILLNSGKFTPVENISGLTKNSVEFRQSLFLNKHYITIQFKTLPSQQ